MKQSSNLFFKLYHQCFVLLIYFFVWFLQCWCVSHWCVRDVHVSEHARVRVHMFMLNIGPVAECREAYTLNQPSCLLA